MCCAPCNTTGPRSSTTCTIPFTRNRSGPRKLVSAAELKAIDDRVAAQIEAAVKFAEESPFPDVRETYTDVYVNY